MEYKRLTKMSDLGTLHALDFNGEEQPLCELTALDTDVLIGRLYELENKIESGELGDVKELKQELKAQEVAANAYRIFFEEQKYWREVAERALSLICADVMSDIQTIVFPKTKKQVSDKQELYSHYIKLSKKELEEEENERL